MAGITECAINPNGEIFICSVIRDISFGNIFKDDFKSIWNRIQRYAFENRMDAKCNNCIYHSICFGSCNLCEIKKKRGLN
jgi:radical SAM protein with 4Fe4S-binding SPASM domain